MIAFAIAEHIEQGGVHSGDASLVLPAPNIKADTFARLKEIVTKIAARLEITGPLNMQVCVCVCVCVCVLCVCVYACKCMHFQFDAPV